MAYTGAMAEQGKRERLAIIDGKSVFYRGYYAMPNLSTKDGTPTGGVYGFAVMALEVIKRLQPDYVCVAWDKPKTNIRKRLEIYPAYKAGRKPPPDDFYAQIPLLHELLEAFGWPLYELDDYEADDIMGTLAVKATEQNIETYLITSDMDVLQMVNPHVHAYMLKKGLSNIELYNPKSFEEKYGLTPDQFVDLKALKGDSSDNIPGVPGIGEKGAIELLKQWKTLDGVYENLWQIKEALRKKLEAGKELAYLSKKLGAIWTDAPVDLRLDHVDGSKVDPARIRAILQRLEFRTLVRQLPEVMQIQEEHETRNEFEHNFWSSKLPDSYIIDSFNDLQELSADLQASDRCVLHSRAAGKHGKHPQLLIISPNPKKVYCLVIDKLSREAVTDALKSYLQNEAVEKIGHDLKTTIQFGLELGFEIRGVGHDTQVGAFLLDPLRRDYSLYAVAVDELGYDGTAPDDGDVEELLSRGSEVISLIRAVSKIQAAELQKLPKLAELARTIEWPVIPVLARMEYEGIRLDTAYLQRMGDRVDDMISDLEQHIYGHADQEFNIGSPQQLAEILFEKMKLSKTGIKKGKTGFSTAASELDKLRGAHPIIDLVSQWREVNKLKNTYIDTLPTMVDENSRVHTTFNLTVAQTGRLSSTDPNLQNIPVRTDLGREIRTAFVAGPDNVFISADYSQFELRLAAYLANDQELIELFNSGADIHTMTAAQVYGRNPDEVTKQMRRDAKVINFGVLYGMSPHGLSVATGMSPAAAKAFIDRYFELRKPLLDYVNQLKKQAYEQGYVETLFGRRRPMPDLKSSNYMVRMAAERAAINMPIQGTEADLMKMAMIAVQEALAGTPARQLLQIHDSILVEAPENIAQQVAAQIKDIMENIYDLPVRLDVDVAVGPNWGEV